MALLNNKREMKMSEGVYGWIMIIMGIVWAVSGNIEIAYTCWCTALILFNMGV